MRASAVGVIVPSTLASSVTGMAREATSPLSVARATLRRLRRRRVLDHGREALADADAHRRDPVAGVTPPQLPDQRRHQARARASERMSERDRASVYVQPLLVDPELAGAGDDLGGERLVELDQVD